MAQKILNSVPKKAGTIDSQREKANRSGVRRCCSVVGGINGPEGGTIRAVGSCRSCDQMIGIATWRQDRDVLADLHSLFPSLLRRVTQESL
jgi:hypothetical protein